MKVINFCVENIFNLKRILNIRLIKVTWNSFESKKKTTLPIWSTIITIWTVICFFWDGFTEKQIVYHRTHLNWKEIKFFLVNSDPVDTTHSNHVIRNWCQWLGISFFPVNKRVYDLYTTHLLTHCQMNQAAFQRLFSRSHTRC